MMTTKLQAAAITIAASLACVPPAHAQTLGDVLGFLVTNQSVDTGSVQRDTAAAQATSDTISRAPITHSPRPTLRARSKRVPSRGCG